jgi:phenylacetate-CoA ligase
MNKPADPISGLLSPKSAVEGVTWPPMPGPRTARALAWLFQLEQSQWLPPAALRARHGAQLNRLLSHAFAASSFHRRRLEGCGWRPGSRLSEQLWRSIPLMTRAELQAHAADIYSRSVPQNHGAVNEVLTSGSTGQPVLVRFTQLAAQLWQVFTVRDHLWHRRDFNNKMATIRFVHDGSADYPRGQELADWGTTTTVVTGTGPSALLHINTPIAQQAEWLVRQDPHYLVTYPSNLEALARHFEEKGLTLPRLRQARAFGEVVEPSVRAACRRVWNVPLTDMYSSQEVSAITLQCPDFEHYHVQEENVVVEVLDEAGGPCAPGQIGRVVVTSLPNFATPIIRYAIGDYAEVGEPCPCGRGLMVLKRIVGRARNMFTLPDGRQVWPSINPTLEGSGLSDYPPILQFQVVQKTVDDLEMLLVMPRPLTPPEENLVRGCLERGIGHRFNVRFRYVDRIAPSPTGKYEDFRSEVAPPERQTV